jgi:hypothetical protein
LGRTLILAAIALSLGGCATAAQRQAFQINENTKAAQAHFIACNAAVYDEPETAPIRSHLPLNLADASLQQLTDTAKPTPDEIQALYVRYPKLHACQADYLRELAPATPTLVPVLADSFRRFDQNMIDLVELKFSWGGYLAQRKAEGVQTRRDVQETYREINAGLAQSNQAELDRRQSALNAMAAFAQTQQVINAINRPTTCTTFGNTTTCR